jgi:hypothetical protein
MRPGRAKPTLLPGNLIFLLISGWLAAFTSFEIYFREIYRWSPASAMFKKCGCRGSSGIFRTGFDGEN